MHHTHTHSPERMERPTSSSSAPKHSSDTYLRYLFIIIGTLAVLLGVLLLLDIALGLFLLIGGGMLLHRYSKPTLPK